MKPIYYYCYLLRKSYMKYTHIQTINDLTVIANDMTETIRLCKVTATAQTHQSKC